MVVHGIARPAQGTCAALQIQVLDIGRQGVVEIELHRKERKQRRHATGRKVTDQEILTARRASCA